MWENETVVLVTSFKKRILSGKQRVRFRKISADDAVPTFIKSLFKNRVESYIEKESPLSIRSTPHFDFKPDDLDNLKNRFLDVFREAAVFDEKEIEGLLKEALVLRLNFLIKPADTMRRLLFENGDAVELTHVEETLDAFKGVLPYAEDLLKECRQQGRTSITGDEYNHIMTEVFERSTKADAVKTVARDLSTLTEFLSETKGEDIARIDGKVLQDFLADRNLWGFRRALDVEIKLGKDDFDMMETEMTLKRYLELKDEFTKETAEEAVVTKKKPEKKKVEIKDEEEKEDKKAQETDEKVSVPEPSQVVQDEPLFEGDHVDLEDVLSQEATVEKAEKVEEEDVEVAQEEEPPKAMRIIRRTQKKEGKEAKEEEKEAKPAPTSIRAEKKGLREFIDEKTEKVFVKKLFGGDNAEYEQLINKLDEAESWRVAKILIDNELFKRDVDPFSREAIKLADLVYGLYYPEEGVGGKK